ncbi:MAG: DinB family protein [Pseudomonadales bacterium]
MLAKAFAYKQWADQRSVAAVATMGASAQAEPRAFALQQLNHIVIVEELFRARLGAEPEPHQATNTVVVPELAALKARLDTSNTWYAAYVATLSASAHDQVIAFRFADGQPGSMSRLEILFHIINHASYHRGAIGHALDRAQAQRPADTYPLFIHESEPERREIAS